MESSRVIGIGHPLRHRAARDPDSAIKRVSNARTVSPAASACACAWAAIARRALRIADLWTVRKTISYYALHVCVATLLAYVVTGNWRSAITLSLLEPSVQAFAYYLHERVWQRHGKAAGPMQTPSRSG
jgi:uncharacterized membrane protein